MEEVLVGDVGSGVEGNGMLIVFPSKPWGFYPPLLRSCDLLVTRHHLRHLRHFLPLLSGGFFFLRLLTPGAASPGGAVGFLS